MLQAVENAPSIHARKLDVERDRARRVLPCQGETRIAASRNKNFETAFASHLQHDLREIQIVFDDQECPVAGLEIGAVIIDGAFHDDGHLRLEFPCKLRCCLELGMRNPSANIRLIAHRQVQCERASLADRAVELDFSAEQGCDLAADRQTETGSAVSARDRSVRLLERLENNPVLFRCDTDSGILYREGNHGFGTAEGLVVLAPSAFRRSHRDRNVPAVGELERI